MCYVIEDLGTQCKEYANGGYINDSVSATTIIHDVVEDLLIRKSSLDSVKVFHSIGFIFKNEVG
jgi:hypothetical protein